VKKPIRILQRRIQIDIERIPMTRKQKEIKQNQNKIKHFDNRYKEIVWID
jgi:hypothetical protein